MESPPADSRPKRQRSSSDIDQNKKRKTVHPDSEPQKTSNDPLVRLPPEIVLSILSFLEDATIIRSCAVSKQWLGFIKESVSTRPVEWLQKKFTDLLVSINDASSESKWEAFLELSKISAFRPKFASHSGIHLNSKQVSRSGSDVPSLCAFHATSNHACWIVEVDDEYQLCARTRIGNGELGPLLSWNSETLMGERLDRISCVKFWGVDNDDERVVLEVTAYKGDQKQTELVCLQLPNLLVAWVTECPPSTMIYPIFQGIRCAYNHQIPAIFPSCSQYEDALWPIQLCIVSTKSGELQVIKDELEKDLPGVTDTLRCYDPSMIQFYGKNRWILAVLSFGTEDRLEGESGLRPSKEILAITDTATGSCVATLDLPRNNKLLRDCGYEWDVHGFDIQIEPTFGTSSDEESSDVRTETRRVHIVGYAYADWGKHPSRTCFAEWVVDIACTSTSTSGGPNNESRGSGGSDNKEYQFALDPVQLATFSVPDDFEDVVESSSHENKYYKFTYRVDPIRKWAVFTHNNESKPLPHVCKIRAIDAGEDYVDIKGASASEIKRWKLRHYRAYDINDVSLPFDKNRLYGVVARTKKASSGFFDMLLDLDHYYEWEKYWIDHGEMVSKCRPQLQPDVLAVGEMALFFE
ncbi:hypothetical protein BJ508DRAFT_363767 [Ascobolus immersus RN42]|uniref:F-box domain-containing protein n=1 Tax=Ascobolus immersus RN42 TaxID=1160509 RepID=A0A3N4I313_ASCIM|nr:hypothetical protein BJ508DRAFT_363767 [Ascobolus immersus RN42]